MTVTNPKRGDRIALVSLARAVRMAASGDARHVREASGVALAPMSRATGVSTATLSRWERGLCRPSGAAAVRWVELLDQLRETGARDAS
ncbi:MAG: hypothetical protein DLM57_12520 [Pseudonocardiales bacterium]|nr:MAG: hypothetical protein DLM57_12520 [Pseudonocardiales bacterium]